MLDGYDRARQYSKCHEVETYHGLVAEAQLRNWLSHFLPKRYGVTSGYVVSPGVPSSTKAPHFDVIVYDQLESPVLWIENSPDVSVEAASRAIPVENVCAVLEVKSSFESTTVKQAIEHLADLSPVMAGVDDPQAQYKLHLPSTFCCGTVFFEVREDEFYKDTALAQMITGHTLRGFFGGVVLRAQGIPEPHTGRIRLVTSESPVESTLAPGKAAIFEYGRSSSREISENLHLASVIEWSESAFARFGFDLLAMIKGKYSPQRPSSLYGGGNAFVEMMRDVGARIIMTDTDVSPDPAP